jgi:two-component system, LytTR family, sensor kinase
LKKIWYILTNRQNNSVSLDKELTVLKEYFYLYKKRYSDGLLLSIDIPAEAMQKQIAPITLQILLENAIKHNAFSVSKPLQFEISYQEGILTVANTINPKTAKEKSMGIGLKNVIERHELLFHKTILVEQSHNRFMVKIPLE